MIGRHSLDSLDLGPRAAPRFGKLAYVAMLLGVVWGFVYLFVQLTSSWQVALGCVGLLVGYMLFSGWLADRSADGGRDDTMN